MTSYGGLGDEFWRAKPLVGMIHLPALPGSPAGGAAMDEALSRAITDAISLEAGGANAVIVENFFDSPFPRDRSPAHTIAAMALAVREVARTVRIPVGVNVLRNDAISAMAIAHVCGARFIRVNIYVGAAVTDQGIIQGAAREVTLYRRELGAAVAIWADVFVKHAAQLGSVSLEDASRDAVLRGRADALIVSGSATGKPTDPEEVRRVKEAVPGCPVLVGSGASESTAAALLRHADGLIVGTSLKREGQLDQPVDPARARALRHRMDRARD